MYIHEAVKQAIERKTNIRRRKWNGFEWELSPTEPITAFTLHKGGVCWNPTVDELMADDWEICSRLYGNGELIEKQTSATIKS